MQQRGALQRGLASPMTAIRCPAYRDRSLWWLVCATRAPAPAPSGASRSNSHGIYASPFNPVATDGRRRQLPAVVESHDEPGSARAAVDARHPGGFYVTDVPLLEPLPVAHEHVARDRCQLRQLRLTEQALRVG